MNEELRIEIITSVELSMCVKIALLSLCKRAYEKDLEPLYQTFSNPVHVVGYLNNSIDYEAVGVSSRHFCLSKQLDFMDARLHPVFVCEYESI
jgi:hypothetical protein